MIYRNQTNTLAQIQAMSRMRITNSQEAVAFLRALAPLQEQVAFVLQRASIARQQEINKVSQVPVQETPAPAPVVSAPETFVPEDLSSDEGFSEKEVEEKVEKLKAARKKESRKEESRKEESHKKEK